MGFLGRRWMLLVGMVLIVGLCYHGALRCGLVFDDVSAVRDNRDLRPHTPLSNLLFNDFWGTPMKKEQSHKSYRPLCVLTFRGNYHWHQLRPMGYHLVNLLLHALVCILFFRTCTLFTSEASSALAALLFAVHPIHTEAVAGVVGRAELLSSMFFLLSFMAYARATSTPRATDWRWFVVSLISVAAAMLSKEQGITVVGVSLAYELFVVRKLRCRWPGGVRSVPDWLLCTVCRLTALSLFTLCLLVIRLRVMGAQLPVFTRFDNPASAAETVPRLLTYNYLVGLNAALLLWPSPLCCDWTMGTVPLVTSIGDPRNLITLGAYATLSLLAIRALTRRDRTSDVIIMGLALMASPFLPASNLFFPVGFVVAERVLYMPSMGFCLLVSAGCCRLLRAPHRWRLLVVMATAWLVLFHGLKTYHRTGDWESEYTIFMAGLQVTRANAKLYNNVGHALEAERRYQEALLYFQHAVRVQPDDIGAHINVGRTHTTLDQLQEAEQAYRTAKQLLPRARPGQTYQARIAPNHLNVLLNLANLLARNASRLEEADTLYRQAISMRADYTRAYINRGDVLIRMNRTREAQRVYETALRYDTDNADLYYNLGVVWLEQGDQERAQTYLDQALERDPDHQQALLNSAVIIQESGTPERRPAAYARLQRLLALEPSAVGRDRVFFTLGMLATDDQQPEKAELWLRKAVEARADFRSALFNLALLLSEAGRPREAVPFLTSLVHHHPDHVKALVLLGDIYVNTLRQLELAEQCYQSILRLQPDHAQALHNLCVVYVERGELARAETCLRRAAALAPDEAYIRRHLGIVEQRRRAAAAPNAAAGSAPRSHASNSPASET